MAENPLSDFWPAFGIKGEFIKTSDDDGLSLAAKVMAYFGIPVASNSANGIGGSLADLDIKHMDAIQVVKMSLLEAAAKDDIYYELMVNSEGEAEFIPVGEFVGLSETAVYHKIQTSSYRSPCAGVLVTGGKPLASRRPPVWKPIWNDSDKLIFDADMLHNSCTKKDFAQYATIVYNDPHVSTAYNDGIDNFYEINEDNPWDRLIGYAKAIRYPGQDEDLDTTITLNSSADILIPIPLDPEKGLGELLLRPAIAEGLDELIDPSCWVGGTYNLPEPKTGIEVPLDPKFRYETLRKTQIDKFININDVYLVGTPIDTLMGKPASGYSAVKEYDSTVPGDSEIWVGINKVQDEIFKLDRGKHYVVHYDGEPGESRTPYLFFANNARPLDPSQFSGEVTYYVEPYCALYSSGEENALSGKGIILPLSKTEGLIVKELWVSVKLNTPSISIFNPDGRDNKALEIAKNLDYQMAALIAVEPPAPMAFNGNIIDRAASKQDHDPTTAQDFSDTPLELVYDQMDGGGGISLTMSVLEDEEDVARLSSVLYDYMESQDGITSTYICGPEEDPKLGGTANDGGIVNSITYSYNDSNSYTISVTTGPKLVGGLSSVTGDVSYKQTEEVSTTGTIIQDEGNHVFFKVRMDGYGERVAVNMTSDILRVGDKVNCTVHNNPVEQ